MLLNRIYVCIQTNNIELKKLVYLYLINYAKSQPESGWLFYFNRDIVLYLIRLPYSLVFILSPFYPISLNQLCWL
jgi:hypothetical protein